MGLRVYLSQLSLEEKCRAIPAMVNQIPGLRSLRAQGSGFIGFRVCGRECFRFSCSGLPGCFWGSMVFSMQGVRVVGSRVLEQRHCDEG